MLNHIGTIILSGGSGTRLGCGPAKGLVLLPRVQKTLLQILLEKVPKKSNFVAIMTSPLNHDAIKTYLEKEDYFGLENCTLFQQTLSNCRPSGNGKALFHFWEEGIGPFWKKNGIRFVQVIPVDNPYATPFDLEMVAHHEEAELVVRGIKKRDKTEKVGTLIPRQSLTVVEYIKPQSPQCDEAFLGHSGIFSCTMPFIERVQTIDLSPHRVEKEINGKMESYEEYLIIDLFPYANSFKIIVSKREDHFAPIKYRYGHDSLDQVDQKLFRQIKRHRKN